MAMTAVKLKIMPSSPESNIEKIQEDAKQKLEKAGSLNISFVTEDIAFGLKAVIATFAWPEEKDTDLIESITFEDVSSTQIIDYRRAVG